MRDHGTAMGIVLLVLGFQAIRGAVVWCKEWLERRKKPPQ